MWSLAPWCAQGSLGAGTRRSSGRQQHGPWPQQSREMAAGRAPRSCTGFQDADNPVCDCKEFGSRQHYPLAEEELNQGSTGRTKRCKQLWEVYTGERDSPGAELGGTEITLAQNLLPWTPLFCGQSTAGPDPALLCGEDVNEQPSNDEGGQQGGKK